MKLSHLPLVALFGAVLCGSEARAQSEVSATPEVPGKAEQLKRTQRMRDEMALLNDGALFGKPTAPPTDLADLKSFFQLLPGRFRIEGEVEGISSNGLVGGYVRASGKITGVADCRSVGEGLGVNCIINATWPAIDSDVADIGGGESRSEMLNTFRPAVLVLGVDPNPNWLRIRTLLVTADSFSHDGLGTLADNTMRAQRMTDCLRVDPPKWPRCFRAIEVTAEPQNGIVTLRLFTGGATNISLTLHPDADARADKKLKSLKAR